MTDTPPAVAPAPSRDKPADPVAQPPRDIWLVLLYLLLMLLGMGITALGVVWYLQRDEIVVLGFGVLALILVAALYPLASAALMLARRTGEGGAGPEQLLASINERLLISDAAKRITYRRQDREALRRAIKEDIERRDFDAAMVLVNEMGQVYGYKAEAEQFREQITAARQAEQDQQIEQFIARLDKTLTERRWDEAARQAAKIQRLYPDSPRVSDLDSRVVNAREQYKVQLERKFLQAAQRDEVEQAMELLKEMDHYLSPQEAEPFRETARGVIGKKRQNLGVQFKLAIQDQDFITAVQVGHEIIREFPNTKMADEVRSSMDALRTRANRQRASSTGETP